MTRLLVCCPLVFWSFVAVADESFDVVPESVELTSRLDRAQLVVTAASQSSSDLTRGVTYEPADESIVAVDERGRLVPRSDGETTVLVRHGETTVEIPVAVSGITTPSPVSFSEQVVPVLTKTGCNSGGCHASQYGKGEFKLSLFGFAPEEDHPQIARDWNQRRLSLIDPADSLILKKPTLQVSHGGGQRFDVDSIEYEVLLEWIASGAPLPNDEDPHVVGMTVYPEERVYAEGDQQQLRIVAEYDDGSTRDVTHLAMYDSLGEGGRDRRRAGVGDDCRRRAGGRDGAVPGPSPGVDGRHAVRRRRCGDGPTGRVQAAKPDRRDDRGPLASVGRHSVRIVQRRRVRPTRVSRRHRDVAHSGTDRCVSQFGIRESTWTNSLTNYSD